MTDLHPWSRLEFTWSSRGPVSGGQVTWLQLIDVSDPAQPTELGAVGSNCTLREVAVQGDTAFVSAQECGLWTVDVADPANPVLGENVSAAPPNTRGVFPGAGGVTYLADQNHGLLVVARPCCADVSGGGVVDVTDLLLVLLNWGACPGCPQDVDGDDVVGVSDLIEVIVNWGPCSS